MTTIKKKLFVFVTLCILAVTILGQSFYDICKREEELKKLEGRQKVDLLNYLAYEYRYERPERAMEFAQKAINLSREIKYARGEGYGHLNMAQMLMIKNRSDDTINNHILKAKHIFKVVNSREGLIECRILLAKLVRLSDPNKALKNLYELIEICENNQFKKELYSIYFSIGCVYRVNNSYQESEDFFKRAFEIADNPYDQAVIFWQLSINYRGQNTAGKVILNINKALEILESNGYSGSAWALKANKALYYKEQNKYEPALKIWSEITDSVKGELPEEKFRRIAHMTEINLKLKRIREAKKWIAEMELLFPSVKNESIQYWYYKIVSEYNETQNRYREALFNLKKSHAIKERVEGVEVKKKLNEQKTKYESEIKDHEIMSLTKQRSLLILVFILAGIIFFSIMGFLIKRYYYIFTFWKRKHYIGNYRIVEQVGAGGMGVVYKARSLLDKDKVVAIKMLRDEFEETSDHVTRFKREGTIVDSLNHENIIKVFERGEANGRLYIVTEFIDGITLEEYINQKPGAGIAEKVAIMTQVSSALAAVHEKKIVFRDIKPSNIMVSREDGVGVQVKLLDFGLANTWYHSRLTQKGVLIGTINYQAPEQLTDLEFDFSSDIYSMGRIFYELISGQIEYSKDSLDSIVKKITHEEIEELIETNRDIPANLNQLIMSMLDKDPEKRPSAEQVMSLLKSITHTS